MHSTYLRPPTPADEASFLALAKASRQLHGAWVCAPAKPEQFCAYLERMGQTGNFAYLVCQRQPIEKIIGVINLTNVIRGAFCSGYLGYYAFAGSERQGLMREGLKALVRHAFKVMKLHRLEANIQPGNAASLALVAACGFAKEGYSPRYLKIAGKWCDHERWAIVSR